MMVKLEIQIQLWIFALKKKESEKSEFPPVLQIGIPTESLREGCSEARTWNTSMAWQKCFAADICGSLTPFT